MEATDASAAGSNGIKSIDAVTDSTGCNDSEQPSSQIPIPPSEPFKQIASMDSDLNEKTAVANSGLVSAAPSQPEAMDIDQPHVEGDKNTNTISEPTAEVESVAVKYPEEGKTDAAVVVSEVKPVQTEEKKPETATSEAKRLDAGENVETAEQVKPQEIAENVEQTVEPVVKENSNEGTKDVKPVEPADSVQTVSESVDKPKADEIAKDEPEPMDEGSLGFDSQNLKSDSLAPASELAGFEQQESNMSDVPHPVHTTPNCDDDRALMSGDISNDQTSEGKEKKEENKEPLSFHSSLKHILPKDKQISSENASNCSPLEDEAPKPKLEEEENSLLDMPENTNNTTRGGEESDTKGSGTDTPGGTKKKKKVYRGGDLSKLRQRLSVMTGSSLEDIFTADRLFEYQWPQTGNKKGGEQFMIQEQVSQYLGVLSFKRKYPDIFRRPLEPDERTFLRSKDVVTEMQCDLGLTAVRVDDIHDLLSKDFPEKYEEYINVVREKQRKQQQEARKEREEQHKQERSNPVLLRKKALKDAADFNRQFMEAKRFERRAYFDLQTHEVHFPKNKYKVLPKEATKPGAYPVAVIQSQFQHHYKKYSSDELKYFPLNTALYTPPRHMPNIYADPAPVSEEEEEIKMEAGAAGAAAAAENGKESDSSGDSSSSSDDDASTAPTASEAAEDDTASNQPMDDDDDDMDSQSTCSNRRRSSRRRTPKKRIAEDAPAATPSPAGRGRGRKRGGGGGGGATHADIASPPEEKKVKKVKIRLENRGASGHYAEVVKSSNAAPCHICKGKEDHDDERVQCSECKRQSHPKCLSLTDKMVKQIKSYDWQCMECKTCIECKDPSFEDKMLFCDCCDRGFHTFCVGVNRIPSGRWECVSCRGEHLYKGARGRGRKNSL